MRNLYDVDARIGGHDLTIRYELDADGPLVDRVWLHRGGRRREITERVDFHWRLAQAVAQTVEGDYLDRIAAALDEEQDSETDECA